MTTAEKLRRYQLERERLAGLGRRQKPPGDTRDLAARKAGLSGRSAQKGLAVLHAVLDRQANPDHAEQCRNLSLLLENSIDAAYLRAKSWGWICKGTKPQQTPEAILKHLLSARKCILEVLETANNREHATELSAAFELGILRLNQGYEQWRRREGLEEGGPQP